MVTTTFCHLIGITGSVLTITTRKMCGKIALISSNLILNFVLLQFTLLSTVYQIVHTRLQLLLLELTKISDFPIRHHTNPVGTEWRWQMDDPTVIVDGAMQNHYKMIKQFRGKQSTV